MKNVALTSIEQAVVTALVSAILRELPQSSEAKNDCARHGGSDRTGAIGDDVSWRRQNPIYHGRPTS
jgi:hypothetical protein